MATHKNFTSAFKALYRRIESVKKDLPSVLAKEGTKFWLSNFDKQGFQDESLQKWKPRKKEKSKKDSTRSILVKSGKLRRAVNKSVVEKTFNRIVWRIGSEVPYAAVHNDGGVVNKKERKHTLYFRETSTNIKTGVATRVFTKKNGRGMMRASSMNKVTIGAYSFRMPKREFMGESRTLNKRFKQRIIEAYKKAFS